MITVNMIFLKHDFNHDTVLWQMDVTQNRLLVVLEIWETLVPRVILKVYITAEPEPKNRRPHSGDY